MANENKRYKPSNEQNRKYQDEIVRKCLANDGNAIVVLPTGTGKTRIAFNVMLKALNLHPERKIVFLCPTIILANQQAEAFKDYLRFFDWVGEEVDVGIVAGDKSNFTPQVVFATGGKFNVEIKKDPDLYFDNLSLLVLDECHNSIVKANRDSLHPYANIMKMYRSVKVLSKRPKVIGLTASPGASEGEIQKLASKLEAKLVSANKDDLKEFAKVAETKGKKLYSERLSQQLEDIENDLKQASESEAQFLKKKLHVCRLFGYNLSSDIGDDFVKTLDTKTLARGRSPIFRYIQQRLTELTIKNETIRAIIFVETVLCAKLLSKYLNTELQGIQSDYLTGQSELSRSEQVKRMSDFSFGRINVLIATSVAEEGVDIPSCNLVMRTEIPRTIVSNIQARGRARYKDADYELLAISEKDYVDINELKEREVEANHLLNICLQTDEGSPCITSWSNFYRPAKTIGEGVREQFNVQANIECAKSELNLFLQKALRPQSYELVATYKSKRDVWNFLSWRATVEVNGQEFEGDAYSRKKDAERSAAKYALENLKRDHSALGFDRRLARKAHSYFQTEDDTDDSSIDLDPPNDFDTPSYPKDRAYTSEFMLAFRDVCSQKPKGLREDLDTIMEETAGNRMNKNKFWMSDGFERFCTQVLFDS
eukprot:m.5938 g.5938  ORF g.5938 m.5938 type:complete len:654 (-) comp3445_c0_seq1:1188-3149(-)